jgi:hypothetical protein
VGCAAAHPQDAVPTHALLLLGADVVVSTNGPGISPAVDVAALESQLAQAEEKAEEEVHTTTLSAMLSTYAHLQHAESRINAAKAAAAPHHTRYVTFRVTPSLALSDPRRPASSAAVTLRGPAEAVDGGDGWLARLGRGPLARTLMHLHSELHLSPLLGSLLRVRLPQP